MFWQERVYFVSDRDGTESIYAASVSLTRGEVKEDFEKATNPPKEEDEEEGEDEEAESDDDDADDDQDDADDDADDADGDDGDADDDAEEQPPRGMVGCDRIAGGEERDDADDDVAEPDKPGFPIYGSRHFYSHCASISGAKLDLLSRHGRRAVRQGLPPLLLGGREARECTCG